MLVWKPRSLKSGLVAMVAVCVVPAALAATLLVVRAHALQRDDVDQGTVLLARSVATNLDREMAGVEASLRVLSSSRSLADVDLDTFHRRARDALGHPLIDGYRLSDVHRRLVLDTQRGPREQLPDGPVPVELDAVFQDGLPVLTGVSHDARDAGWRVTMGVPVRRDDEVPYCLHVSIGSQRITSLLRRQALPAGWIAVVLDRTGTIVARSERPEIFVGLKPSADLLKAAAERTEGTLDTTTRDGVRVLSAFSRSATSGWTVAVGAPTAALTRDLARSAAITFFAVAAAFALGVGCALHLGRHLTRAVDSLIEPARRLGSGRPTDVPRQSLAELETLAAALREANLRLANAQHSALHDPLTGLANRAFLEQAAPGLLASVCRRGGATAVLALDLDGFKQVNDRLGHAAGDRVLQAAAIRLTAALRAGDVAARIGGDEFVVVLPDTDTDAARIVGDKLIAALSAPYLEADTPVSTSVGIAVANPAAEEGWTPLLARADAALYAAKRAGKGRLELDPAGPPTPDAPASSPEGWATHPAD